MDYARNKGVRRALTAQLKEAEYLNGYYLTVYLIKDM